MERVFKYTLAVLISIVAILEFYQVIMRYILELPVMGLDEILVYPTLWLYFLGSVNASREDTQIKANVLDVFLSSDRSKLIVRCLADLMGLIVAVWLTTWAYKYFLYALKMWKESATLYIPTFFSECAFFIGMVLMSFYAAWYLFVNVKKLLANPETAKGVLQWNWKL